MFLYAMVLVTGMTLEQIVSYPAIYQGMCVERKISRKCALFWDGGDIVYAVYFEVNPWGKKPLEIRQVLKDNPDEQVVIFLDESVRV